MPKPHPAVVTVVDPSTNQSPTERIPRTVQVAKPVELALVTYTDDKGQRVTQLAVIGELTAHMLEAKHMGLSQVTTPQGRASDWLRNGIFEALGKELPEEEKEDQS